VLLGALQDHMGYYGGVEDSPLVRFHGRASQNPIYLTTFSGRVRPGRSNDGDRA